MSILNDKQIVYISLQDNRVSIFKFIQLWNYCFIQISFYIQFVNQYLLVDACELFLIDFWVVTITEPR